MELKRLRESGKQWFGLAGAKDRLGVGYLLPGHIAINPVVVDAHLEEWDAE